jgi:hypothetical protein
MTWNYRVVNNKGNFGIYEVYYDENGNANAWSQDPMEPYGESLEELRADLKRMLMALERPLFDLKKEKT